MLLVPRQLRRTGLTGDVPYYGGRLTPAQAYAASHEAAPPNPLPGAPGSAAGPAGAFSRTMVPSGSDRAGAEPPRAPAPSLEDSLTTLQGLLNAGLVTQTEYDELRARLGA